MSTTVTERSRSAGYSASPFSPHKSDVYDGLRLRPPVKKAIALLRCRIAIGFLRDL
ncbi:MAG: hypothetical protein V7K50_17540 [Nostoc sp.]|uniref:hypothetical protein n=1 Tax=Nostoc sp. TaxID=1180 RepID=UPI002FFA6475